MLRKTQIVGSVLMFIALVSASIAFFSIDWTLGVLFCSFICYRIGYYLSEPKLKIR